MKSIFPSYFCSLITPPNKDEMLKGIKNAKIDKKQEISWNKICRVKVDVLHPDEIIALLSPSLSMFFREWGFGERKIELLNVWKNTLRKECIKKFMIIWRMIFLDVSFSKIIIKILVSFIFRIDIHQILAIDGKRFLMI